MKIVKTDAYVEFAADPGNTFYDEEIHDSYRVITIPIDYYVENESEAKFAQREMSEDDAARFVSEYALAEKEADLGI